VSRARCLAGTICLSLFVFGGCAGARAAKSAVVGGGKSPTLSVRWRWPAPKPASVGAPAVDANGVVVTYSQERLVLFDVDGHVRWEAARTAVRGQPPRLTPDLVLAPTDDGSLVAFDRATGTIRWDAKVGGDYADVATPVVVAGMAVTCVDEGSIVGVDVRTGKVVWRVTVPGAAEGPPATDGRAVFASWEPERGTAAGLIAIDPATGTRHWSAPLRAGGVSAPAAARASDGSSYVVVVDDDLAAKAFDAISGRPRWKATLRGAGSPEVPPLALADGRVLVADRLAGLTLFDADGKQRWTARGDGAAVQAGPAGPTPDGRYALPLYNGKLFLAGPGRGTSTFDPPGGLANGAAVIPGHELYVTTAQGPANQLVAYGISTR